MRTTNVLSNALSFYASLKAISNMETIFDFNPTQQEIERLSFGLSKEEYERRMPAEVKILDIANMLYDRKDDRYKKYADTIPENSKADFYRSISHF